MSEGRPNVPPILRAVANALGLLADLNRGDCLLYERQPDGGLRVLAQARPHSVPPVLGDPRVGQPPRQEAMAALTEILAGRKSAEARLEMASHRSHVVQRTFPVHEGARLVGVLAIEKSLVEHERHATRRDAFRRALHDLRDMALRGDGAAWESLPHFRETDGIMLVSPHRVITYMSGLGSYHYRQLGYYRELIGSSVAQLDTADGTLVAQAERDGRPFADERLEEDRIWVRTVVPLVGPRWRLPEPMGHFGAAGIGQLGRSGTLIAIHDATAARQKEQERLVRRAMVQEIHHRVKNNLQTVASLLRIQARRAEHEETRRVLADSINRILSIAVVHEFFSQHERTINIRDVAERIAAQVRDGILDPSRSISVQVQGDTVYLHAHQTTMVALIINELILNALEHGFGDQVEGTITVELLDQGDAVHVAVRDSGAGLPSDFELATASSLGLRIVQTIVEGDLQGHFELVGEERGGTAAIVAFPKNSAAGEGFEPI